MIQPCRSFRLFVCWLRRQDFTWPRKQAFNSLCVLLASYCCNKDNCAKQLGEEEVCASFQLALHFEGWLGQELTAGPCRQELKQRPWRSTAHGLLSRLSQLPSLDSLLRGGTARTVLGPPSSVISQWKAEPHFDLPSGQSDEGIFSIEVTSSQMILTITLRNHKDDLGLYHCALCMPC